MLSPVDAKIRLSDGSWGIIEVVPVLIEEGRELVPSGLYQLFESFPDMESKNPVMQQLREEYLESIDLQGDDHPAFLGSISFTGCGVFEWKYDGRLNDAEVWQLVDLIQDYELGLLKKGKESPVLLEAVTPGETPLTFLYGKNRVTYTVRMEEMEGNFIIFIDEELTAMAELWEDDWEITGGDIYDPDLLAEIIRRIKANT